MTGKTDLALMSAFAAMEGAHAFSAFLPSIMTIRKFVDDSQAVHAIHDGEKMGAAFAVSLGAIISGLTRSWLPIMFSTGAAILMISVYEHALNTRSTA